MGARPANAEPAVSRLRPMAPLTRPQLAFLMKAARPEGVISREFSERTVRTVAARGLARLSYRPEGAAARMLRVYVATSSGRKYLSEYKRIEHTKSPVHTTKAEVLAWARGMRTVIVALLEEVEQFDKLIDPTVIEEAARLVDETRPLLVRIEGA